MTIKYMIKIGKYKCNKIISTLTTKCQIENQCFVFIIETPLRQILHINVQSINKTV